MRRTDDTVHTVVHGVLGNSSEFNTSVMLWYFDVESVVELQQISTINHQLQSYNALINSDVNMQSVFHSKQECNSLYRMVNFTISPNIK